MNIPSHYAQPTTNRSTPQARSGIGGKSAALIRSRLQVSYGKRPKPAMPPHVRQPPVHPWKLRTASPQAFQPLLQPATADRTQPRTVRLQTSQKGSGGLECRWGAGVRAGDGKDDRNEPP